MADMILWGETKNQKLQNERNISFEEIKEIILRKEHLDILENSSRPNQFIFVVKLNGYIYSVPFVLDEEENIVLKTAFPSRKLAQRYMEREMNSELDKFESEIEKNISQYKPVRAKKKAKIEGVIDKANEKKSISLRLKTNDLELLKRRADLEGMPYQTLLSSIVHKFVTDQLVDKRSILKSLEIIKAS